MCGAGTYYCTTLLQLLPPPWECQAGLSSQPLPSSTFCWVEKELLTVTGVRCFLFCLQTNHWSFI